MKTTTDRDIIASAEDVREFAHRFDIRLFPWQVEAFGEALKRDDGHFHYRLAGISVPRGNGKSHGAAIAAVWRLIFGPPPQDILIAALDVEGARVVLDHTKRIVRSHPELQEAVEERANSLRVPSTGSRLTITSREHTASRGRHPTLIVYDECGWAKDSELFASLMAAQASVLDPLMLVVSTVGRRKSGPLWQIKALAEEDDAKGDVLWWHSSENLSPKVTATFLERQRRILTPAQYAREHQNQWVDAADAFTTQANVDAAMDTGWTERARGVAVTSYVVAVDIGTVHAPSVVGVPHRARDTRTYDDHLVTLRAPPE